MTTPPHAQEAHKLVADALCADPKLKSLGVDPLTANRWQQGLRDGE